MKGTINLTFDDTDGGLKTNGTVDLKLKDQIIDRFLLVDLILRALKTPEIVKKTIGTALVLGISEKIDSSMTVIDLGAIEKARGEK